MALWACTKTGPQQFGGYYSFKTGGTVEITGQIYQVVLDTVKTDTIVHVIPLGPIVFRDTTFIYHVQNDTIGSRDTTVIRHMVAESGQMHILETGGNQMKVTMNITGGDPLVLDATVENNTLVLAPARQRVAVSSECKVGLSDHCYWEVSGRGTRYENMVLFNLDYAGKYTFDGMEGVVTRSEISCIATENE